MKSKFYSLSVFPCMIPDDNGLPKRVGSSISKYFFGILSQYFTYFPTRL